MGPNCRNDERREDEMSFEGSSGEEQEPVR